MEVNMRLFSYDGSLMRFLTLVADLVWLHFLWLFCSLPLFTIGASTTALYYTCMKRIRTQEGYLTRNFFYSLKENFKQATILWLVFAAVGYLFFLDFQIGAGAGGILGKVMTGACALFLVPYLFTLIYIFPVQAKFKNPIKDNVKNAFLMSFRHFFLSLVLLLILGTFLFLGFTFTPMIGLLLICGGGLVGYLTSGVFVQIFRSYIPDEIEKDLEISGEKFRISE